MQTKTLGEFEDSPTTGESDDECLCDSDLTDLGCFEHFTVEEA
jgi:hypothetical protein